MKLDVFPSRFKNIIITDCILFSFSTTERKPIQILLHEYTVNLKQLERVSGGDPCLLCLQTADLDMCDSLSAYVLSEEWRRLCVFDSAPAGK